MPRIKTIINASYGVEIGVMGAEQALQSILGNLIVAS